MEKDSKYKPPQLKDCVAVVTGASRGAGKAIAMELGAAGATVYVTGRSTRGHPAQSYGKLLALSKLPAVPGNIDDTADEVTRLGGKGIAVPCDHTKEEDVAHLFARVQKGQGRLDLLVNNAWGGHETFDGMFDAPFWERGMEHWDSMFDRGGRSRRRPACGSRTRRPACIGAEPMCSSASTLPSARTTRLMPTCPGWPPAMPKAPCLRPFDRMLAVIGSRKRTRRTPPLPPCQRPAPPEPGRIS
jgi:hypothetical protein